MSRFAVNNLPIEMFALWLLELALSYYLAYTLLGSGVSATGLQGAVANQAFVLALTVGLTAFLIGLYRPAVFSRTRGMLVNTALGGLLAFPAAWIVSRALGIDADRIVGHDSLWPLKIVLAWIAALFATRLLFLMAVRSNLFVRRIAIMGSTGAMGPTVAAVRTSQRGFIEVVAGPDADASPDDLRRAGVLDVVVSTTARSAMPQDVVAAFTARGITIETETEFWERHLKRVDVAHIDENWVRLLDSASAGRLQEFVNRVGDIGISLALLVFTAPLMIIVALLVHFDSPGPVLYRQERVGRGGIPFTILKFRSMSANAEAGGPAWAVQRDPRVTRIGSLMRRTRIDELPQLFNVLRGQMSFIGPRPERPHFVTQLAEQIPFYRERARVKPGLTGWAQVNFPYGASVEDARVKLSYDLYYVRHRSPLLDLAILFATVRVILFQEGSR